MNVGCERRDKAVKVIFICQRLHPNYTDSLRALSRAHDVTVLVRKKGFPNERLADLNVEIYQESLLSRSLIALLTMLGRPANRYDRCFPSLRFLLRRLAPGACDVVYVRKPRWLYAATQVAACLRRRPILIYEQEICPASVSPGDRHIYPLVAAPETGGQADYPPRNFIPLTIDLSRDFGEVHCPPHDPDGDAPLRLMHVGKLIERKGQAIIFEAMAALVARGMNVRLAMYSHTPTNAYREKLVETVSRLGIAEHVEFMSPKSPDEMLAEYRKHHLFVYSGWVKTRRSPDALTYERATGACGTRLYSMIEAMAAGLPVVSSSEEIVVGAVENGGNGLVFEKGDATDLAAKIERIAGMDLAAMGARSRELIETHHDAKDFPSRFERMVSS